MGIKYIYLIFITHIFTFVFTPNLFASGVLQQSAHDDRVWFVSGEGAAVTGSDLNPGTADRPLSSVQKALTLIRDAYAEESFKTAVIRIDGKVSNIENKPMVLGLAVIQGKGAYPSVILRGSSDPRQIDTLDAKGFGRVLYIEDGNNVTIENLTLTGGAANAGAGVFVSGSRFTVGKNSFVQNNEGSFGGGVCIEEEGTLIIHGSVKDNKADNGAGAALRGKAVIEIYGTVSGNYAASYGGGVLLDGAEGIISGGTIIGNTAQRGSGGGIFIQGGDAVLVINRADISGNKAQSGGGIFACGEAGIRVYSCVMRNNDARAGGGAALLNALAVLHDADISGNTAVNGGGILIAASFMSMSGCVIQNNSVTSSGGGIFAGIVDEVPAEIIMSDGEIKDNEAEISGGGIYVMNSTFNMTGNSVIRNNSAVNGGGIYATVRDNINISDNAQIEGNTAKNGSDFYIINDNNHPQSGSLADDAG